MTRASCGLVWNPTSSGTRAARHLAGSSVQLRAGTAPGQRTPAPLALASAKKAPTWQLSTLPAVPNTGAAPRPRWCPSPGSRSHRPPAPRQGRPGARPHRRAGRRGPGPDPSRRWPTTAASHRGALAGVLGQLPAVLAPHAAEQPAQVCQHPPAWLGAGEPPRDAGVQGVHPAAHACTSSVTAASSASATIPPARHGRWTASPSQLAGGNPTSSPSAAGVLRDPRAVT
jgi:hypothetical protein